MIFYCPPFGYRRSNQRRAADNLWQVAILDRMHYRLSFRGVTEKKQFFNARELFGDVLKPRKEESFDFESHLFSSVKIQYDVFN
jgi:hypothetical protein